MSTNSLIDAILSLSTDTVVVTRRLGGTMTLGKWTAGAPTTFTATGCMQPAAGLQRITGGRDTISDEAGDHVTDARVFYTPTELRTRTPANEPDQVTFDGGTWTVFRVETWSNAGSETFYKVTLTRSTRAAS